MSYRDRKGKPISELDWQAFTMDPEYVRVAMTTLEDVSVHTLWTGLYPAANFVSMIVEGRRGVDATTYGVADGYTTEEQALAGHQALVEKYSQGS